MLPSRGYFELEDGATNYSETSICFYIPEVLNFYLWFSFVPVE